MKNPWLNEPPNARASFRCHGPDPGLGGFLAARCAETNKRFQALGSAKNHLVAMPDAKTDEMSRIINGHQYGNGASIYTQNGYWARKFKLETNCGMLGVNVGSPAPVASLPFGGMKNSLFADTKGQGKAVIDFFTDRKIITERYWPEA